MKTLINYSIFIFIILLYSCKNSPQNNVQNIDIGNKFIDAFYSFNKDSLESMLGAAQKSQPEILYYQKWAKCANYKILDRSNHFEKNDSVIVFPVKVKDDLMSSLNINFNVTDTFHIVIKNKKILSVKTSSNDIDTYYLAKKWVNKNRPNLVKKPCEGIWVGGPTPCECVLGMIKGFKEFTKNK